MKKTFDAEHEERRLFDAVQEVGEGIFDKIHIINNSAFPEQKVEFRIYHADGYCWDISREAQFSDDDDMVELDPFYDFSENWEGFKESGIEFAINEIESIEI